MRATFPWLMHPPSFGSLMGLSFGKGAASNSEAVGREQWFSKQRVCLFHANSTSRPVVSSESSLPTEQISEQETHGQRGKRGLPHFSRGIPHFSGGQPQNISRCPLFSWGPPRNVLRRPHWIGDRPLSFRGRPHFAGERPLFFRDQPRKVFLRPLFLRKDSLGLKNSSGKTQTRLFQPAASRGNAPQLTTKSPRLTVSKCAYSTGTTSIPTACPPASPTYRDASLK